MGINRAGPLPVKTSFVHGWRMSSDVAAASPGGRGWVSRRAWAHAIAALVVVLVAGWWWGRGLQAAWTAKQLVDAIERGDCTTAAKYSDVVALPEGCPPSLYGLPDDLNGYSLYWDRVQHDSRQNGTVSLMIPSAHSQYSLHTVRKGEGWMVKNTDVLL